MTDIRKNEVKSVTKKRGRLTLEFFDNEGKIRQKDTGLPPTKANRKHLWTKIVPMFEEKLRQNQLTKEARSFGYYANIYLELNSGHSKIIMMRGYVKRFKSYFGEATYPGDIKLTSVKRFFANLKKTNGEKLMRVTKIQWRSTLKNILQLALEDDEIDRNIIDNWKLPKQNDPPSDVKPFTPGQVKLLLKYSQGNIHNYIGVGVLTGLRPEELVGLMIQDIDFEERIIHIRRAFSKHREGSNTKTSSSRRTVPIFNDAIPYLKAQISYAISKRSLFLFCKEDGSQPDSSEDITGRAEYINKNGKLEHSSGEWHKLRDKAGLPKAHLHWTRHTFAVQCLKSKKFTPQEVAGMMGILLRTLYGHYAKYIGDGHTEVDRTIDIFSA